MWVARTMGTWLSPPLRFVAVALFAGPIAGMSRNGVRPADSVRIASPLAPYSGRAGCLLGGDGCIGCWLKGHTGWRRTSMLIPRVCSRPLRAVRKLSPRWALPIGSGAGGGQAMHAAVSALDAAIAAARGSQSGRVAQQAVDMQLASNNYQGTDERAADNSRRRCDPSQCGAQLDGADAFSDRELGFRTFGECFK